MLQLPHGCTASNPSVFPKNWKTGNAELLKIDWRIQYYFKDPSDPYMQKHKNGKLVIVKGMNVFKTLPERRHITQQLLENELYQLQVEGYNPIKRITQRAIDYAGDLLPSTPFIQALKMALSRITVIHHTKIEMDSIIKSVELSGQQLGLINLSIESVTRRHIKNILDRCALNTPKWSSNRYNKFRAYLMMLYKELVEVEAVPFNILRDISKKPVTTKIKTVLTIEQRKKIDDHLAKAFPRFRQFIHLFFHSGGRKTELLQLKPAMINLQEQKYRCMVKKGKNFREVERTIKSVAIPYWKFFLENCPADHYLFGPRFEPALKATCVEMPTRYWQEYVKEGLGINVDFYSLKHSHTTEIVDILSEVDAAIHNSHTSTGMVVKIYDTKQKQRAHDRLKDIGNNFV